MLVSLRVGHKYFAPSPLILSCYHLALRATAQPAAFTCTCVAGAHFFCLFPPAPLVAVLKGALDADAAPAPNLPVPNGLTARLRVP